MIASLARIKHCIAGLNTRKIEKSTDVHVISTEAKSKNLDTIEALWIVVDSVSFDLGWGL
jgi:hypothetical protein